MIPILLLDCTLEAADGEPLDLGANPGASLRGAIYEALAAMYDTGETISSRHDTETNPVAWLLRLEDAEKTGGKDPPRPLAIRPPQASTARQHTFTLALYGRGCDAAPMILSAVAALSGIGVGRDRQLHQARLTGVSARDPLTSQTTPLIDAAGRQIAPLPAPVSPDVYTPFATLLASESLTVRFITPTRIIVGGELCRQPILTHWLHRLLERIRTLTELYAEPVWIPFADLLKAADSVKLAEDETQWQEMWSHSRLDGMYKPLSGFVGTAHYSGDVNALLPYLLVGQAIQVGKNTIKGCGWYEIAYRWR
jgi:CRISPR-associated endoribonuclease Cas6